jgi:hypothetical protein
MNDVVVREKLLQVWGKQACRHLEDWPAVLERLMKPASSSKPGGFARASLEPLVNHAVAQLACVFGDRVPDQPALAVWRAFPKLDRMHCSELAQLLIKARAAESGEEPPETLPWAS